MVYFTGIALISAATILLELALLRLFAVQQFYHFAFMAVSLALLGAGASGSILSIWRRQFHPASQCLAFSIAALGAYLVINNLPFDSFSIAWDRQQLLFLSAYFLAAAVPFLFAGLLVGSQLMSAGNQGAVGEQGHAGSHQIYGANLIGSSLGALASIPILAVFGGVGAVLIAAMTGAIAGLVFGIIETLKREEIARNRIAMALAVFLVLIGAVALFRPPKFLEQRLSPYKTLSVLSQVLDAQHTISKWDSSARADVVESNTIHVMPGLSLLSPAGLPPQAGLMLDGDNLMPITGLSPDSDQAQTLASYLPIGLAYRLRPNAQTLVVEAGTGMEVLFALAAGATEVTAVEENGLVLDIIESEYGAFTHDLYNGPRVTTVKQNGRVFVNQGEQTGYDLVILALTDPHRPVTSGAYSLTEDYRYSVEAFDDYLDSLDQNGLLMATRWLQDPPSESARTFGATAAALEGRDLNPADHLVAFRTLRTLTIFAGLEPFSAKEIGEIRDFLKERNFDAVYFPGIESGELNQYNILEKPAYHDLFVEILSNPDEVYASYRFDIRPPTDDRPFFFHYFKWRQTPEILASLGYFWQPFGGSGYFVLVALLILVGLASTVLIIGPLLLRGRDREWQKPPDIRFWRLRVFTYFACLGLAFLFVEIPLAQRFILILDHPVTALAVVLFAILLFSGLGSLTVRRWRLPLGMGALILLIALYPLLLEPASRVALGLPQWGRILLALAAMAPLGYLMGMPFPGGLRVVEGRQPSFVPWAWAINGSFSVISSVLAVMVALSWGFSAVLWLGAAAYTLALVSFAGLFRKVGRDLEG
jgi:hypothetical protein